MNKECKLLLESLENNISSFDKSTEKENLFIIIRNEIENIAYLTKEMEIQCNCLKNDEIRYNYAQNVNNIDIKRENLQHTISKIMLS